MKLGRLGVWYGTDKLDGSQLRDFVCTVENNGYSALWYPESRGYESMSLAAFLLSSSEKLLIGSSIANIYARDSFTAQRAMVSLNALYGDRFVLNRDVHLPTRAFGSSRHDSIVHIDQVGRATLRQISLRAPEQ